MLYGDFGIVELCGGNAALYEALKFCRDVAPGAADGRHELGRGMFAEIREFAPAPRDERFYETHARYADVQCDLRGDETIFVRSPAGLAVREDALAERDVVFYEQPGDGAPERGFLMRPGFFLLLLPDDAHKPECLTTAAAGRKLVVKIPVEHLVSRQTHGF